jgi:hypothetical protein
VVFGTDLRDATLRLLNPTSSAVTASLAAGDAMERLTIEPGAVIERAMRGHVTVESREALIVTERVDDDDALTNGRDEQLLVVPAPAPKLMTAAACTPIVVGTSSSACRFGTSGAAVETIPGATYAWAVDGAAITSGDGTNRIALAFGAASSATVTVAVHTPDGCTRNGAASISLRDPFRIGSLVAPATTIGDPVTIAWAIAGSDVPRSQTLTINGTPVKIAVTDRSYTFTPTAIGSYGVQLDASLIGGRRRACCRSGDYPIASFCGADSRTVSFSVTPPCEPTTATLSIPSSVTQGVMLTGSVTANGSWTLASALGNPIAPLSGTGSRSFTYAGTTIGNDTLTLRVAGECSTVTRTASVAVNAPPLQVHLSADSYIVPFHSSTKLHVVVENAPPGGFGYVLHSSGGNSCDLITTEGNDSLTYRYIRDESVFDDTVTITATYNGRSAMDSIVIIPHAPCTTTPVLSNVSVSPSVISQGQTATIHFTVSGQSFGYWSLKSALTNTVTPDAGSQTGTFTVTYDGGRARGVDTVRIYAQDQAGTCAVWTDVTISVQ